MPWVTAEKKEIGIVVIEEEGVPTPPPVTPVPTVYESFMKEHRKLKVILDRYGKRGECVTIGTLATEGGVDEERAKKHVDVFVSNDYVAPITEDGVCGREAIKELKKQLQEEL